MKRFLLLCAIVILSMLAIDRMTLRWAHPHTQTIIADAPSDVIAPKLSRKVVSASMRSTHVATLPPDLHKANSIVASVGSRSPASVIAQNKKELLSDPGMEASVRNWNALEDQWNRDVGPFLRNQLGLSEAKVEQYYAMRDARSAKIANELASAQGKPLDQRGLDKVATKMNAIRDDYDHQLQDLIGTSGYQSYRELQNSLITRYMGSIDSVQPTVVGLF